MPPSTKTLIATLLILTGAASIPASACRVLTKEEAARSQLEALARMKTEVLALRDEADLVFVGHLLKLTHHDVTVDAASGSPTILREHQATYTDTAEIKGKYPAGQALAFTTNRSRVVIDCRGDIRDSLPVEKDVGQTYLVYAKDGKILRTSRIPDIQLMDGKQEAELLRSSR